VLRTILASLSEMKAEAPVTIDLSDKASIGEIMVVATGTSNVHLSAIADRVIKDLKKSGYGGVRVEGLRQGDWVLIDAGSVIVHLFRPEVRTFYNIEKMWSA
jgi:ribosome-associated protein